MCIRDRYDAFELSESELIELYSEGYISENTMDQLIEMGVFDEFLGESVAGDAALYNRAVKNNLTRLARPDLLKSKTAAVVSRLKAGLPVGIKGARTGKALQRHILRNPHLANEVKENLKRTLRASMKANYRG